MRHSCVICFLAFALCLVGCLAASADEVDEEDASVVNKEAAIKSVEDAQKVIKEVVEKAQSNIKNATLLSQKMKEFNKQAEEAVTQAQTAEENEKAKVIVDEIKSSADAVSKLYITATSELQTANSSMEKLLSETQQMEEECNKITFSTTKTPENYTEENNKAVKIKQQAETLDTRITNAATIISGVQSKADSMENSVKEVQLKNLHVSCIVAVAEIGAMIGNTDSDILEKKNKKIQVNGIVKEMQTLRETAPSVLIESFDSLIKSAQVELSKATDVLKKSEKAKTDMTDEKQKADAALSSITTAAEVNTAKQAVDTTNGCVKKVKAIVEVLKSALETANTSVTNVKRLKQDMEAALSTTANEPSGNEVKETSNANLPVGEVRGTDQQDAKKQPTTDNAEQPTSKDSTDQSDNSEDILKDALIKSAQNVPTTALTGGKAPAPGDKNDSAMTVSMPLLVALIASAVLQ